MAAIVRGAIGGLLIGAAFIGGYLYRDYVAKPPASATSFALLNEAEGLLAQNYVGTLPDETTRIHGAVKGLVASLNDPYTFFVEPQTAELDSNRLAGSFGGIGVEITRDDQGRFVISRVYRDNPAEQAGVQSGDVIVAIDGVKVDTSAADENAVLAAIRGDVGTKVVLTVERAGKTVDITAIRAEVKVPSVFWQQTDTDPLLGYIQITNFTERTPEEVKLAVAELTSKGVKAFILDLRNNGGGLVDSAVDVVSQFLDGGPVLYERNKDGSERLFNASRRGVALNVPLVILVNANSASASEIVAGALQDRQRAKLIGQKTYGKGSVQVILPLSDGSSLHVTTAEWYTPNHHRLQGQGLIPDIATQPSTGTDAEMTEAIKLLEQTLSTSK